MIEKAVIEAGGDEGKVLEILRESFRKSCDESQYALLLFDAKDGTAH
jgi:hypothetical protein